MGKVRRGGYVTMHKQGESVLTLDWMWVQGQSYNNMKVQNWGSWLETQYKNQKEA